MSDAELGERVRALAAEAVAKRNKIWNTPNISSQLNPMVGCRDELMAQIIDDFARAVLTMIEEES